MKLTRLTLAVLLTFAMLISLAIVSAVCGEDEEVAFEELPAAVQQTLQNELDGGTIQEIEKEIEDGQTTYEAEVLIDGEEWDIEIAEDGTLISKEKDADQDNKCHDEDGDEDDEDEDDEDDD